MVERPEAAAGVVEDAVEHHPDPARVAGVEQLAEGRVAAEQGVDRQVVVRVVAVVRRRREDRVEVDRVDAQRNEMVEMLGDAEEVPALEAGLGGRRVPGLQRARLVDPRARREAVREDLVEDGVADPIRGYDGHGLDLRLDRSWEMRCASRCGPSSRATTVPSSRSSAKGRRPCARGR